MSSSIVNVHQLEKLRALGALEQWSSARHDLGFYHNVGISAAYVCKSHGSSNIKENIFAALSIVMKRHQILFAIPVDEDTSNPYFARLPEINLEAAVIFISRKHALKEGEKDAELDSLLEAQHNLPFKAHYGSLPFWRLIILSHPNTENEFVASFIYHHALGDGGSGVTLHKHFFSALSSNPAPLTNKILYPVKTPLLSPLEELHSLPIPSPPPTPYFPKALWTGKNIALPMISRFRSLTIPQETTTRLIHACRANCTTITATIPVIIASALIQIIPTHFNDLECTVPVNIRRWLPESINDDVMGTWIDAFSQYYHREDVKEFSWKEARRSRESIVEYLKSEGKRINVAKFKMIPGMREFFLSKVGQERSSSFDVSNLGGVKILGDRGVQEWQMGRMIFSRSAFVSGSAISSGVLTGADGSLVFGFCWQEGIVDLDIVESLVKKVRAQVEHLAWNRE